MLTYSELVSLPTFEERFEYLKLSGSVGEFTFGSHRWLNQYFYHTKEWLDFKSRMIIRDNACDLAFPGRDIFKSITLHHLNPITKDDVIRRSPNLLSPENVVCVSDLTHKAIHYSNESILIRDPVSRLPNDTCPWKR